MQTSENKLQCKYLWQVMYVSHNVWIGSELSSCWAHVWARVWATEPAVTHCENRIASDIWAEFNIKHQCLQDFKHGYCRMSNTNFAGCHAQTLPDFPDSKSRLCRMPLSRSSMSAPWMLADSLTASRLHPAGRHPDCCFLRPLLPNKNQHI